ncbi:redoxin domain-containing protein [Nannocystis bainbridge]|uniref:Redoxin domain-containing protein n=1 Tax=Nannocystis bainbridge TaxID=2995303 RepID=A0ABT5E505_9BACT|nr:redoxin domain-containing protein [Nannocystis bainbridge]MDC0720921.1 redoxin domain-containing protein [Nannocystis bainbridge]
MPDTLAVRTTIALALALTLVGCARAAPERPAPVVLDPADIAADVLRDRLTALDSFGCARDGEPLVRQHLASGRLRAWWIGCVAAAGRLDEAATLAAAMLSEKPGDPWAELAAVLAGLGGGNIEPTLFARSEALLHSLPEHADAVVARAWLLKHMRRPAQLLALAAAEPGVPASARVFALSDAARSDPTRLPEALSLAGGVAPDDPEFIAVAEAAASMLAQHGRPVEALAWAEAGLRRAPDAPALLGLRWHLAQLQPGAGGGVEAVLADIDGAVAGHPDRPDILLAAVEGARGLGRAGHAAPLEQRLLAEHPDSPEAESVLHRRLDLRAAGSTPADAEAALLRDTMLAAFLARPHHHDPSKLADVARWRFEARLADPAATPEAILAAVEDMVAHDPEEPHPKLNGARALFARTPYHERAGELARAGVEATEAYARAWREAGSEHIDLIRRSLVSDGNTTLGGLALKAGRLDDAQTAFRRAEIHGLGPFAELQLGLAEVARRRGDFDAAELHLVAGLGLAGEGGERCRDALADLHRARTGSARGLSQYFEEVEARSAERRKRKILAEYDESAATPPDFSLRSIDGREITLASLRGKLVVLHFWFKTCGGCLVELPEFSAFAAAHADDPDVAVVSLHYGGSLGDVAQWVRERQLPFPVLMDDGYADRAGVQAYPTTWFLDREGRRRFGGLGISRYLRQEFEWRIDALRASSPVHAG